LDAGDTKLTDNDGFIDTIAPAEGYLSVGDLTSGYTELRNLVLRDSSSMMLIVDSTTYVVDRWNVALVGPVTGTPVGSVTTFAAGDVLFSLSVVYDGALYRAAGTNVNAFTLELTSMGWEVDGLKLEFVDGATTWSFYNWSTLEFGF
jgi:hypothetical protein